MRSAFARRLPPCAGHARRPAGRLRSPGDDLLAAMRRHPDRRFGTRSPELPLIVDRERARFGAWYELFPRSQGRDPKRPTATTFADAVWRLAAHRGDGLRRRLRAADPSHRAHEPQGPQQHARCRRRTTWVARTPSARPMAATTPSRPSSAGSRRFIHFREQVEAHGMELAMDIAIQASPDHPYVAQHPEWFRHSPDGTIKYAENPPKKYQDIYPIDFAGDDPAARRRCGRSGSESSPSGSIAASRSSGSTIRTPSRSRSGGGSSARSSATTPR